MQYAVAAVAGVRVSQSAVKDEAAWAVLTKGQPDMTFAPASILAARSLIRTVLPEIQLASLGIVGDDNHAQTGSSYHLGKSALRPDSYTITESSRDRNGLSEAASALDFGWWTRSVAGKTHNLRSFSVWLVAQCKAETADTRDIREVIYSPDGSTVRRWDRLGIRSTGDDTHLTHTHVSWFRDSEVRDKTGVFRRYFTEIGLIEGDLVTTQAEFNTLMDSWWSARLAAGAADNPQRTALRVAPWQQMVGATTTSTHNMLFGEMRNNLLRLVTVVDKILANVVADDDDLATIQAEIREAEQNIITGLAQSQASPEDIAQALKVALGDRAARVGELLAGA